MKKLYLVNVSFSFCVVAEEEEIDDINYDSYILKEAFDNEADHVDLLDYREIKSKKDLNSEWLNALPYLYECALDTTEEKTCRQWLEDS